MKKNYTKKFDLILILRLTFIIIFLSAGLYRIVFFKYALKEASLLGLSKGFAYFIIIFEISISLLLILNRSLKIVVFVLIAFLSGAIIYVLATKFNYIINKIYNIFTFSPEPDDILLHLLYIGGLIILLLKIDNEKKKKN